MGFADKIKGKYSEFRQKREEEKEFNQEKKEAANEEYNKTYRREAVGEARMQARERAIKKAHSPPIARRIGHAAIGAVKGTGKGTVDFLKSMSFEGHTQDLMPPQRERVEMEPAQSKFSPSTDKFMNMSLPDSKEHGASPILNNAFFTGDGKNKFASLISEGKSNNKFGNIMGSGKGGNKFASMLSMNEGKKRKGGSEFASLLSMNEGKRKKGGSEFSSLKFFDGTKKKGKKKRNEFGLF